MCFSTFFRQRCWCLLLEPWPRLQSPMTRHHIPPTINNTRLPETGVTLQPYLESGIGTEYTCIALGRRPHSPPSLHHTKTPTRHHHTQNVTNYSHRLSGALHKHPLLQPHLRGGFLRRLVWPLQGHRAHLRAAVRPAVTPWHSRLHKGQCRQPEADRPDLQHHRHANLHGLQVRP